MNAVIFKPAINSTSGLAHLKRCATLAKTMSDHFDTAVICPNDSPHSITLLESLSIDTIVTPRHCSLQDEIRFYPSSTVAVVADISDTVHRKQLQNTRNYFKCLQNKRLISIVIDGVGEESMVNQDMTEIDVVVSPYDLPSNQLISRNTRALSGIQYVILNHDYLNARKKLSRPENLPILITFGGSDPNFVTEKVCQFIHKDATLQQQKYNVVLGLYFDSQRIERIKEKFFNQKNIIFFSNLDSLNTLFHNSSIAIIGSGAASRYEAAFFGVPSAMISLSKSHDQFCKNFEQYGCSKFLGFYQNMTQNVFAKQITALIDNAEKRREMSQNSKLIGLESGATKLCSELTKIIRTLINDRD